MKIEAMQELSALNLSIGGIGAITCSLMGIMSNGLTMWVIFKNSNIQGHLTSPLLFLMCFSNFLFSSIGLPIKGNCNLLKGIDKKTIRRYGILRLHLLF